MEELFMKILLLCGESGTGKTRISEMLGEDNCIYNVIYSYTDRPMREKNESGHIFIDKEIMDILWDSGAVVARTEIDGYKYCSFKSQFDDNKINIYIVDGHGVEDTKSSFPNAEILTIQLNREVDLNDKTRISRDIIQ